MNVRKRSAAWALALALPLTLGAPAAVRAETTPPSGPTPGAVLDDAGCFGTTLYRNDDGSSEAVALPFTADYFGRQFESVYVNNNGNVTFESPQSTYTPYSIDANIPPMIAAFFADVDTRPEDGGTVTYGQTTYQGFDAFCVTWRDVGYYSDHTDLKNTFQLLMVHRPDAGTGAFDVVFNYDAITWETGDASSGAGGRDGTSAGAGFSNGDGRAEHFYEIPGSRIPGSFLDSNESGLVHTRTGSDVPGRHVFQVRDGEAASGDLAGLERDFPTGRIGYAFENRGLGKWTKDGPLDINHITDVPRENALRDEDLRKTFSDWGSMPSGHVLWGLGDRRQNAINQLASRMDGGLCFGFALTGGRFGGGLASLSDASDNRTAPEWLKPYAFALPKPGSAGQTYDTEFLVMVTRTHATQFSTESTRSTLRQHDAYKDQTQGVQSFKKQLASVMKHGTDLYDPSTKLNTSPTGYAALGMINPAYGHEVVAYAAKENEDGTIVVSVWDSNEPNEPNYLTVRPNGNWSYTGDPELMDGKLSMSPEAEDSGERLGLLDVQPLFSPTGLTYLPDGPGRGATLGSGALVDVPAGVTVEATDAAGHPVQSLRVKAGAGVDAGSIVNMISGSGTISLSGTSQPSVSVRSSDGVVAAESTTDAPTSISVEQGSQAVTVTSGAADLTVATKDQDLVATSSGATKLKVTDEGTIETVSTGEVTVKVLALDEGTLKEATLTATPSGEDKTASFSSAQIVAAVDSAPAVDTTTPPQTPPVEPTPVTPPPAPAPAPAPAPVYPVPAPTAAPSPSPTSTPSPRPTATPTPSPTTTPPAPAPEPAPSPDSPTSRPVNPRNAKPDTKATPAPVAHRLPATVPSTAVATAAWKRFPGAVGAVAYDVQIRLVSVDKKGKRVYTGWKPAKDDTLNTSMQIKGRPGQVIQYRVQGTDSKGTTSSWSKPARLIIATNADGRSGTTTKGWTYARHARAVGKNMLQAARKGAAFTAKPQYTDSISVVVGKNPKGGKAFVYVDGTLRATVNTRAKRTTPAQLGATIKVPYGKHTVKIVNGGGTLHLDGLGFGR